MDRIEFNTIRAFRKAKGDIIKLQNAIIELENTQAALLDRIGKLESKNIKLKNVLKEEHNPKMHTTRAKAHYIASKEGKKFHTLNCPFAQNIKPKSKVHFHSKTKALNEGYKPCNCIV